MANTGYPSLGQGTGSRSISSFLGQAKKKEQPAWEKPAVPRVRAPLAIKPSKDLISYRLLKPCLFRGW